MLNVSCAHAMPMPNACLTPGCYRAPASRSWGSIMGQLVIDSRLLAANPYSSWVHSAGTKGSLPFFKKKNMDWKLTKTRTWVRMLAMLVRPSTGR